MYGMGGVPDKLLEAQKANDNHVHFKSELVKMGVSLNFSFSRANNYPFQLDNSEPSRRFFTHSDELLRSNKIPREYVIQLNESVTNQWRRLCALTEERHKLLQTAVMYYKTDESLTPILDQLERMCSVSNPRYRNHKNYRNPGMTFLGLKIISSIS